MTATAAAQAGARASARDEIDDAVPVHDAIAVNRRI